MNLKNFLSRKNTPNSEQKWLVKVNTVKGMDLHFKSRQEAREYKRLLRSSSKNLEATIIKHQSIGDYMLEDEVAA